MEQTWNWRRNKNNQPQPHNCVWMQIVEIPLDSKKQIPALDKVSSCCCVITNSTIYFIGRRVVAWIRVVHVMKGSDNRIVVYLLRMHCIALHCESNFDVGRMGSNTLVTPQSTIESIGMPWSLFDLRCDIYNFSRCHNKVNHVHIILFAFNLNAVFIGNEFAKNRSNTQRTKIYRCNGSYPKLGEEWKAKFDESKERIK